MSLRARSRSVLSRMRHGMTQKKNEMTSGENKTYARVTLLNLFRRVLHDAAIKREWTDAIYARRDYPIDNRQRPDNRRNSGSPRFRIWRTESNLSPSTYLTTIAARSRCTAPRGVRVNETFVIVPSNPRCRSLPPLLSPFNDHRIHRIYCLHLETTDKMKL